MFIKDVDNRSDREPVSGRNRRECGIVRFQSIQNIDDRGRSYRLAPAAERMVFHKRFTTVFAFQTSSLIIDSRIEVNKDLHMELTDLIVFNETSKGTTIRTDIVFELQSDEEILIMKGRNRFNGINFFLF